MAARRLAAALTVGALICPCPALAQSAGDEQYMDPLAGGSPAQGGARGAPERSQGAGEPSSGGAERSGTAGASSGPASDAAAASSSRGSHSSPASSAAPEGSSAAGADAGSPASGADGGGSLPRTGPSALLATVALGIAAGLGGSLLRWAARDEDRRRRPFP